MKWATKVDSVGRDHVEDKKESGSILIEGIGVDENFESLSKCSSIRSEVTTQIGLTNEPLEKLNQNLIKIMTILQGNSDNIEKLKSDLKILRKDVEENFDYIKWTNDDLQSLEKNLAELKEKIPDEDMTSLVQELKSCIKSNRSIDKDYSTIKEKLYKTNHSNDIF